MSDEEAPNALLAELHAERAARLAAVRPSAANAIGSEPVERRRPNERKRRRKERNSWPSRPAEELVRAELVRADERDDLGRLPEEIQCEACLEKEDYGSFLSGVCLACVQEARQRGFTVKIVENPRPNRKLLGATFQCGCGKWFKNEFARMQHQDSGACVARGRTPYPLAELPSGFSYFEG